MYRTARPGARGRSGLVAALALVGLALSGIEATANEIPAFARRYGVSCSLCHDPMPRLTDFGDRFAGNGFRMSAAEPPRDTIDTGDPLLDLLSDLPLAIRFDGFFNTFTNGETQTDFETPFGIKILSGAPLSKKLSYYFYFFFDERGEVGGVEDAFIYVNDIADLPLDLAVGQFQVSDPMFKRELRLEFQDYAVYRARIGEQPADLTYDRGVMVGGDVGGFTLTGMVVNGNGRGPAESDRRFDDDPVKSVFAHISRDVTPFLRLGAMGYRGRQSVQPEDGVSEVDNTLWMLGADATIGHGPLELNAQYIHREDDAPTFTPGEPIAQTDGGFAELLYIPSGARWYALALYNRVDADRPLLNVRLGGPASVRRYETIAGGVGYLVRRNLRVMAEGGWDIEQETTRWTLGVVTAF